MHNYWKRVCLNTETNIKRLGVENFYKFPEIRDTMLVCDMSKSVYQLPYLMEKNYLDTELMLRDEVLGDNHPQKIQSLYHVYKFIENGGKIPKTGTVVEVGAGIGCMVDIFRKAGFTGKYSIIDLDTINKIQRYYLESNSCLDKVDFIGPKSNKVSLLIGTWSISEMPLEDRRYGEYLAEQYLLAYGDLFNGELDNTEYFNEFKDWRKDINWVEVPVFETQKYLFGYKKQEKKVKNEK
jgi:hypothetical protein